MQLFYRLPIIKIKTNPCPKKKLFPFGTRLENFSQAFDMGLTIFLPLIEITLYECSPYPGQRTHKITFVVPDNRQIKRLSKTFILRMFWMPHLW